MAVVAGMVVAAGSALRADDERLQTAATVLTEMTSAPDNDIPASLMQKAKCVVVIPGVKKAALGVGGQYGRGYIACRRDVSGGWSAPGAIRIEGGSIGFQIGGSDTDVILLVLQLYVWVLIVSAILSWLIAFNVVNTRNQVVATIWDFLYRITEPVLGPIRSRMPYMGGIDISPIIVLLLIFLIQRVIALYLYPNVF